MVRKDGTYHIFILQFRDTPDKEWCNSGDCDQWIPENLTRKQWEAIVFNKGPLRPLGANGDCWQITGIQGTFVRKEAIRALHKIAEWNPTRRFRVCELLIIQQTTQIAEVKYG